MEKKLDFYLLFSKLFQDIDEERVMMSVENLRDEYPQMSNQQLAQKIIDDEALFCGVVGAATGALPWPWSILGIAPDLAALITKQSRMVLSISYVYGYEPGARERAVEVLGCIGSSVGAVAGTYGIKELVRRRLQKDFILEVARKIGLALTGRIGARLVPVIGAIAGGFFNFGSVQAAGNMAIKYYKNRDNYAPAEVGSKAGDEFVEDVTGIEEDRSKEGTRQDVEAARRRSDEGRQDAEETITEQEAPRESQPEEGEESRDHSDEFEEEGEEESEESAEDEEMTESDQGEEDEEEESGERG